MERQFKGIWIDAEIWLHPKLSAVDKVLLADIHSFTGNGKTFYKTNDTLADELFVSVKTVSRSMKKLSEMGLIRIGGTKRKRLVWSLYQSGQIDQDTGHNVLHTSQNVPSDGTNCPTTNTKTNTTTNTTTKEELVYPFEDERFKTAWAEWIQERRDRKLRKFTFKGEQAALKNLGEISNLDLETAIAIINQSIAHNYQGLFPIKHDKRTSKKFDSLKYRDYLSTLGQDDP
jgi:hypothetical protein